MVSPPQKSWFSEPKRFKKHVSDKNASKRGPSGDFGPSKCLQGRHHDDFCPKRLPKGASGGPVEGQNQPFFRPWACLGANVALGSPKARFWEHF